MKINYYTFYAVYQGKTRWEFKTLSRAKRVFLFLIQKGAYFKSNYIYGKAKEDVDTALSYTLYYYDSQSFGKTKLTTCGELSKAGFTYFR